MILFVYNFISFYLFSAEESFNSNDYRICPEDVFSVVRNYHLTMKRTRRRFRGNFAAQHVVETISLPAWQANTNIFWKFYIRYSNCKDLSFNQKHSPPKLVFKRLCKLLGYNVRGLQCFCFGTCVKIGTKSPVWVYPANNRRENPCPDSCNRFQCLEIWCLCFFVHFPGASQERRYHIYTCGQLLVNRSDLKSPN